MKSMTIILGLIAWWPEDGHTNDIIGGHNPSATNALTFMGGAVGQGVTWFGWLY